MKRRDALAYWAVASDGSTVYVGQTCNFRSRYRSHQHSSTWFPEAVTWWTTEEVPADLAFVLERYAIRTLMPFHNVTSHPDHSKVDRLGTEWDERVSESDREVIVKVFEAAEVADLTFRAVRRRRAAVPEIPTGRCDRGHEIPDCTPFDYEGACMSCERAIVKKFMPHASAA